MMAAISQDIFLLFWGLVSIVWACDDELTDQNGSFQTPNYPENYPSYATCKWSIRTQLGETIRLTFEDFHLEIGFLGICNDKVYIYDGERRLGTYCGRNNPGTITSTTNTLRVEFYSDGSIERRGFNATYETTGTSITDAPGGSSTPSYNGTTLEPTINPTIAPGECGEIHIADSGTVTSPNYPNWYPNRLDCSYFISLESPGLIVLTFDDFNVEGSSTCWDVLEIYDGFGVDQKSLGSYCSTDITKQFRFTGKDIYMRFKTDSTGRRRGWSARWQKATCEMYNGYCDRTCGSEGDFVDIECGQGLKCCKPKIFPDECGVPEVDPGLHGYIVGGEEAVPHSWPWQASLQYSSDHYCGAILLNNEWVVTAAHCVYGKSVSRFEVLLGEHNRRISEGPERKLRASLVVIHPNYVDDAPWPNDIALVKMSEAVEFSMYYLPSCLPEDEDQDFLPEDDCYMTGWGDTKGTGSEYVLNQLQLDPVTNQECRDMWGGQYIEDFHICVGYGDIGSCNGDSGGPYVCRKAGRWVLAGITSWGIRGCETYGYPSVYTRISKFRSWLEMTMYSN